MRLAVVQGILTSDEIYFRTLCKRIRRAMVALKTMKGHLILFDAAVVIIARISGDFNWYQDERV